MKKITTKLSLFLIFSFTPILCWGQHVLPVFSGNWYTAATFNYADSCMQAMYQYQNQHQGDPLTVATQLLGTPPVHTDCQWQKNSLLSTSSRMPDDFTGNNETDWDSIASTPGAVLTSYYGRACLDQYGNQLDSQEVTLQPSYTCPAGSRFGFDSSTSTLGCSTQPNACEADIVGRDLKVLFINQKGHVGLTIADTPFSVVLEVLKDPQEGIFENNLSDFKNIPNAPFWGEKFGLAQQPFLSEADASNILDTGVAQTQYPFSYTLTWNWHPGSNSYQYLFNPKVNQWQKYFVATDAEFRCDSFVYYCYLQGANLSIVPQFAFPDTPKTLYDAFLGKRDPVGTLTSYLNSSTQDRLSGSNPNVLLGLTKAFSNPVLDISTADVASKNFVSETSLTATFKINTLWNLLLNYQKNEDKFSYLCDILAYVRPISLIPQMIQLFPSQSPKNQKKLLVLMSHLLHYDSDPTSTLSLGDVKNIILLQNFFHSLSQHSQDPVLLNFLLQIYPSLMPTDIAKEDIESTLERLNNVSSQAVLTLPQKIALNLNLAFATQGSQKEFVSHFLTASLLDIKHKKTWNASLCFKLQNMPPEWLDDSIRGPLKEVLNQNQAELLQFHGLTQNMNISNCSWLDAYATVSSHSTQEKKIFIRNYLKSLSEPFLLASILRPLNTTSLEALSKQDKVHLKSLLLYPLRPSLNRNNLIALQLGISKLK